MEKRRQHRRYEGLHRSPEPAPAAPPARETINTREKETVDNDAEILTLEELIHDV